ncbi:MAG: hypothetical protein ACYCW6_21345, partial [Candidatus Xenobia bacterium]
MRKLTDALVLLALCALPVCAQQKLGSIVSGNEAIDLSVKQDGAKSIASLDFYSRGDSYRLSALLDSNDVTRLQSLIGSANSMDIKAMPVNRHLSLGVVKGISVEVERASGDA